MKRIYAILTMFLIAAAASFTAVAQTPTVADIESDIPMMSDLEVHPLFQGQDHNAFAPWVSSKLVYPRNCSLNGIEGKVTVTFTVDKQGNVKDVTVIESAHPDLDAEAVRVISTSPQWTPGYVKMSDGSHKPVSVKYTHPIIFSLKRTVHTVQYAQKDTCSLYMDIYDPAPGSKTKIDGKTKPTIIHIFGGGFIGGKRSDRDVLKWFRQLNAEGFRVVAIDYRLGLKGVKKMGIGQQKLLRKAIDMAVEDLFSATAYLVSHAQELGIEADNIVVSGSSAGAITALQAEWDICNGHEICRELPQGFNYAGIMAFAGAIFSNEGKIKFPKTPAPIMMMHGIDDKIVNYKQISFLNLRFAGSHIISKSLAKCSDNYQIFRFTGYGHEISIEMEHQLERELFFLSNNVVKGLPTVVDATVTDNSIRHFRSFSKLDDLYH